MRRLAALAIAAAFGCGPKCERYDVLRADLTRGTGNGPDVATVYSEGAGGLKVKATEPSADFSALEAALIGTSSAAGTARLGANFGSNRLLLMELPMPLVSGQVITIDTLLDDVRFTGGYEGYGWWDSAWRWSSTVGAPRATLIALFEETLSAKAIRGTVTVSSLGPVKLLVELVATDKDDKVEGVYAEAIVSRSLGVELCSTGETEVSP